MVVDSAWLYLFCSIFSVLLIRLLSWLELMPKIQTLQSLRALAALLVVFDHTSLGIKRPGLFEHVPFLGLFLGAQGVAIFFIISGFIITYTADAPDDQVSHTERAIHFAKRRIARLVPLYWLLTLLVAVPAFFSGPAGRQEISAGHLLKSLFFIPYANGHGDMVPIFLLGWTLNYEMAFYALFAVLMLLPHRFRIPALWTIFPALVAIGAFFYPIASGANPRSVGAFLTNPIILLFGLGAALSWLRMRYPDFVLKLPGLPLVLPLLAINGTLALVVHQDPFHLRWTALFWLVDWMIVALAIFGRPVRLRWMEAVGDASYSLYLIHALPVIFCFVLWKLAHFAAPVVFIVVSLTVSALTALACYRWVERPLTRSFARLLEGRRSSSAVVTVASALQ